MDKFFISNKQNITQNLDENTTNEQEIYQNNLEENDVQFCNTTNLNNELQNNLEEYKKGLIFNSRLRSQNV